MPTTAPTTRRTASSSAATSFASNRDVEDEALRPYIVVGDIGKGSFATVYKGYHEVSSCETRTRLVRLKARRKPTNKLLSRPSDEINSLPNCSITYKVK